MILYLQLNIVLFSILITGGHTLATHYSSYTSRRVDCGQYGFYCEGNKKLRLCDNNSLYGPSFICPSDTICNEESNKVCEPIANYVDPIISKAIRCRRYERIADPSVPGCKGYILCIPNKNRFQGINYKCSGKTIFNGYTRSCSSPDKYKCPVGNSTKSATELFKRVRDDSFEDDIDFQSPPTKEHGLNCKNYKFTLTEDGLGRVEYFCPLRPAKGEFTTRCTLFSNKFCITLQRDDEDQFVQSYGAAYRRPRN